MATSALVMFTVSNVAVFGFAVYYFYKVVVTPPAPDDPAEPGVKSYDAT